MKGHTGWVVYGGLVEAVREMGYEMTERYRDTNYDELFHGTGITVLRYSGMVV
jgi:hypothetical protein